MTATVTYMCNLNVRNKWFGYTHGDLVTVAGVTEFDTDDDDIACELAFMFWNADDRPNGQTAPSLSVGDVVVVRTHDENGWRHFACARMGFEAIEPPNEFVPDPPTTLVDLLNAEADRINEENRK